MIALEQVCYSYPGSDFSLQIPELSVAAGEQVAVIGPSGTGKTTFLNLLAGIAVADSGSVKLADKTLNDLSDDDRRHFRITHIGQIFQRFELIPYLTARDNILHPYRISDMQLTAEVEARADDLAADLGIKSLLARFPGQLSQGESQRVAICRALLPQPQLILADEPTANLDPANKEIILDVLLREAAGRGLTLIVVTHDHGLLPRFQRVIDFQELLN